MKRSRTNKTGIVVMPTRSEWRRLLQGKVAAGIVVVLVGIAGTLLVLRSHALTSSAAIEAESGTMAGGSVVNDTSASGGRAFRFGATQTSGTADEIHYTITGPTSVSFDWRGTATGISFGKTTAYGTNVTASGPVEVKENGTEVTMKPNDNAGPFREARLTGLQAGTTYHYSIGVSADHTFHTAPAAGTSGFTVAVEADIGNPKDFPDMQAIQNMIAGANPSFVIAAGDFDYSNGSPKDGQIEALFGNAALGANKNGLEAFSLTTPLEPSWGNHEIEYANDSGTCTGNNPANFKARFDFAHPMQVPVDSQYCNDGGGEDWHWFDYGNTRFIAVPEPYPDDWASWYNKVQSIMAAAQSDANIKYIVTFGHTPAYSSGYHAGEPQLADYDAQLHAKYSKFFLQLNGHSHDYERTDPTKTKGVTHITVGTGGGYLENAGCSNGWASVNGSCAKPAWSAVRFMRYGYLKLTFGASNITGQFICGPPGGDTHYDACTQGSVIDSFTVQ